LDATPVQWQTVVVAVGISCVLGICAQLIYAMRRSLALSIAHRIRLIRQASEYAEMGRRLAIYDKTTGFLAPWYFRLRFTEECERCRRYARVFVLLTLDAAPEDQSDLNQWLTASLRGTDLVCYDGSGRYFVLLSETNEAGAYMVIKRILRVFGRLRVSSATYPAEDQRVRSLLASLDALTKQAA
jgi:GGDEF domain-containing protein